jgi:YesN/AraC family two-component response regulator
MAIRILIVDDERAIVDSLAEIIEAAGYEVARAYGGTEALSKISEFRPNVLLSDVLMPDVHGFDLALQVKKACPDCRLILFSGQAATAKLALDYSRTFSRLGYRFQLLPKPLHPEALLKKLEESLSHAA